MAVDLGTIIAEGNQLAAAWYNAIKTNTPVQAPSASSLALSGSVGSTQTQFANANPVLAGLLIQPGFIVLVIAVVALVIFLRR